MDRKILIKREVVDNILTYGRMFHPREAILILKGENDKRILVIKETLIPPFATHGNTFSAFPLQTLPIDFSVVGVAHSHPSGALRPSVKDLNRFYGRIMVISAYPYQSEKNIGVFDHKGKTLRYEII